MTILEPIRSRLCLLLYLCSLGSAIPCICLAGERSLQISISHIKIDPEPIRLPIVDATDNRFLPLSTVEGLSQIKADYIVQDNAGFSRGNRSASKPEKTDELCEEELGFGTAKAVVASGVVTLDNLYMACSGSHAINR
jgi:hypothetical protein